MAEFLTIIKDGKKYDAKNPSGDTVVGFENLAIEGLDFMWGLKYSSSSKKWDRGQNNRYLKTVKFIILRCVLIVKPEILLPRGKFGFLVEVKFGQELKMMNTKIRFA